MINSLLWRDFYRFIVHYAWGNRRRGYDWLCRTVWVHVSGFRVQGSVQEFRCSLKESSLLRTSWGLGTEQRCDELERSRCLQAFRRFLGPSIGLDRLPQKASNNPHNQRPTEGIFLGSAGLRMYHLYGPMNCGSVPGGHKTPTKWWPVDCSSFSSAFHDLGLGFRG